MSFNTSFARLFDLASVPNFAGREINVGSFEVKEQNTNQSLVPLTLLRVEQADAEFTSFNNRLVHGMKDITECRTSIIHDIDCDGIAFVSHDMQDGLILAELKSRFSTKHVTDAFCQMITSFLKLHAMLSLCEEYSIDSVSLQLIAACQCFENNTQRDSVYDFLNKAESSEGETFEGSFLQKLIEKQNIDVKFGDITSLWGIPLNSSLTEKRLTLSLQMTQNYGDNSVRYTL